MLAAVCFWCGCRSTVAHTGKERGEGAARIGGGAAETVGVTGVVGTDWLISHSHLQGIKDRGVGKGFGRVCMCVRV